MLQVTRVVSLFNRNECRKGEVAIVMGGLHRSTSDTGGDLRVVDTRASTRQASSRTHELHPRKIASVHINPVNDIYLATASVDKTACVWDLRYY